MQAQAPPQALMRIASHSPLPSAGTTANSAGHGSSRRRVAPTPVHQVTTQGQMFLLPCPAIQLTSEARPSAVLWSRSMGQQSAIIGTIAPALS